MNGLAFYDWDNTELIRRIEIQPKHVSVSWLLLGGLSLEYLSSSGQEGPFAHCSPGPIMLSTMPFT